MSRTFEPDVIEALLNRGVSSPRAVSNVLGQLAAESGRLNAVERLNYTPERAFAVFGTAYFPGGIEDARATLAQGEEAFANRVYGGRMGNAPDEGYRYRGRGAVQLTGRDNYAAASRGLGVDFVGNPDLAADPRYSAQIAAWFLTDRAKLSERQMEDLGQLSAAIGFRPSTGSTAKRSRLAQRYLMDIEQGRLPIQPLSAVGPTTEVASGAPAPFAPAPSKRSRSCWDRLRKAFLQARR